MSKLRYPWWGYIKQVLYRYPACSDFEKRAVDAAIRTTERMDGGKSRIEVINLVFFRKTHRLAGAALQVPCGYETAKRWQAAFIREVARNFQCENLLKE